MRTTRTYEDEGKLAALLDWVADGDEVVITRQGANVARLIPAEPIFDREKARQAAANILARSKGVTLGGLKIKDLISEGRR